MEHEVLCKWYEARNTFLGLDLREMDPETGRQLALAVVDKIPEAAWLCSVVSHADSQGFHEFICGIFERETVPCARVYAAFYDGFNGPEHANRRQREEWAHAILASARLGYPLAQALVGHDDSSQDNDAMAEEFHRKSANAMEPWGLLTHSCDQLYRDEPLGPDEDWDRVWANLKLAASFGIYVAVREYTEMLATRVIDEIDSDELGEGYDPTDEDLLREFFIWTEKFLQRHSREMDSDTDTQIVLDAIDKAMIAFTRWNDGIKFDIFVPFASALLKRGAYTLRGDNGEVPRQILRILSYYEACTTHATEQIHAWGLAALRLGIYSDIRRLISRLIWDTRCSVMHEFIPRTNIRLFSDSE
jgi:hypothetical protein